MLYYFSSLIKNWKIAFGDKNFLVKALLTFTFYGIFFKVFRIATEIMETRTGTQLNDFVLAFLPPKDFSEITFTLTYIALILFIITTIHNPQRFVLYMQAYTMLLILRMMTIYLLPLEPPAGLIILKDPVSNFFMKSTSESGYIVKDLFFSGHISAIFLFYLCSVSKYLKLSFLLIGALVASLILMQHVHYTIDIVAAPFFSIFAYKVALYFNSEYALQINQGA
ncbi:MAG: hypothetical protein M9887_03320 [Chitinophagales bacterium]|nr:hypothetical protein [Chitinophagales bacterium]